jgi:hypothetical protein
LVPDRRPLEPDLLASVRRSFGSSLAKYRSYDSGKAATLGSQLDAARDGRDLWLAFTWSGREMLGAVDDTDSAPAFTAVADAFALDVAASLKEQRGRSGVPLPWDD